MMKYEKIVPKARKGDSAAIQALYDDTLNSVWYIVTRLVDRHEDAEDLVQDIFLTVFSRLDQLQEPQAFPKWVHRIATNAATNHLKKKRPILFATDEQEEQMLNSIPAVGEDFLPEEFALNQDRRNLLMSAIAQLPEKQRMAIFLHYYEGTSVKELSETLNVGENTVKSRLNAGRAGIRKHLEKMGISGVTMTVLALALHNDAAATLAPASVHTAVWTAIQSTLAAGVTVGTAVAGGTTATTATAAGVGSTATKVATATTVFLSTLWGKITAALVAAALLASGISLVNLGKTEPPPTDYGVPEEVRSIERYIYDSDDNMELFQKTLPLATHNFGTPLATYEFDNGMRAQYFADGYLKVYLPRDILDRYPFANAIQVPPEEIYRLHLFAADGTHLGTLPYCGGSYSLTEGNVGVYSICATNYNDDGDYVYYTDGRYFDSSKSPAYIVCKNGTSDGIGDTTGGITMFRTDLTQTSGSSPVDPPEPPQPFQSAYGVPEEMGFCEQSLDHPENMEVFQKELPLLTHDFGEPIATYEFYDGRMKLQCFPDGYIKFYLSRDVPEEYPFSLPDPSKPPTELYYLHLVNAEGFGLAMLPYHGRMTSFADESNETVDLICSTDYHDTGDYVYYAHMPLDLSSPPTHIICESDDLGFLFRTDQT